MFFASFTAMMHFEHTLDTGDYKTDGNVWEFRIWISSVPSLEMPSWSLFCKTLRGTQLVQTLKLLSEKISGREKHHNNDDDKKIQWCPKLILSSAVVTNQTW
jgi:hypothetical protein